MWATGTITNTPEIKYSFDGHPEVHFDIRCDLNSGERAEWIRCHFRGEVALVVTNALRHDIVAISGSPRLYPWISKDGRAQARFEMEVARAQIIHKGEGL